MTGSSYPNFTGKHAGEALFTAADFLSYLRRIGARDEGAAPAGVVLCYQRSLYDHALRAEGITPPRSPLPLPVALPSTGGRVGLLGQFGIGAPAATTAPAAVDTFSPSTTARTRLNSTSEPTSPSMVSTSTVSPGATDNDTFSTARTKP